MAIAEVGGTPVAVTGGIDGVVRVWDLRTGTARGKPVIPGGLFNRLLLRWRGHKWNVQGLAVGDVDGTPVAVTGSDDGTVRVWDLRTGAARGEPLRGHTDRVSTVAVRKVDSTSVAVTGSTHGTVRVWDLRTGMARGGPLRSHRAWFKPIAVGEANGTMVAVIGDPDGTITMWALDRDRPPSVRIDAPAGIADIAFAGRIGWITATNDGSVFMWHQESIPRN